ncbi:MAG TPA: WhiB family transcriptional regulator [Gemmatimonadales bacterium]|nr:WhiB family transcriptional regulator [Gemmatimonadales bacterium]
MMPQAPPLVALVRLLARQEWLDDALCANLAVIRMPDGTPVRRRVRVRVDGEERWSRPIPVVDWAWVDRLFHPTDSGTHPAGAAARAAAKRICARCPVREECLRYVEQLEAEIGPQDGIWAGLTPEERQAVREEIA